MTSNSTNDQAFLDLIETNRPRIMKICRVYAWSPADRDDLYQEILCQIWRALPGLNDTSVAATWVYRVALNTAFRFVRKDKARRSRFVDKDESFMANMPGNAPPGDVETEAQIAALYRAIARLNEMEKAVITLFLDDLSYADIAKITGLSETNIGVLLHRAKKKLITLIKETPCTTMP